ncbi:serine hydrolase [Lysobacter pythonis]|uniref:Serine hydrolase n=1 Tax=Solilutibacter pythonis TaxID=2483112 RepID=A0A3M2I097_9GAMM|nr:serine hydrolase [Lysobacter pythonis]RMH93573.1 serine hydrolase [Lysobacter pythonis]
MRELLLALALAWAPIPVLVAQTAPATVNDARLVAFDARVEAVRKRFDVPGIAVAIVQDGRVVTARGYGLREVGKPAPVDAHTLFAIASNTKAFTATALEMLAEDGKLDMDDRVIDHLPWFRMGDPYVTREMRVRDLLAHRSGLSLGAGDLLFWPPSDYSNREVAERLANVPLTGQFRGQYAYDNILYGVAQLVVEQASGQSFKDFLRERIFAPLGMRETRYNSDDLKPGDNVATGHARPDFGKSLVTVGTLSWRNVAGAGGLYASVHDLGKWMNVQLANGVISGRGASAKRLFPAARQRRMWTMLTPIAVAEPAVPELQPMVPNFLGYGEGWMLSDYRGEKLVWHTGGWPGMVSRLTLVPGRKIGVVVLTNQEAGAAFNALTYEALDMMLGGARHDWLDAYAKAVAKADALADESWKKLSAARDAKSKPSLPLARYVGTWRDPWYGDVFVRREGKGLSMRFSRTPALSGRLEHWQHDSFIVRWDDRTLNADAFVYFALEPDGTIREMRMKPVSPKTDFSFDFQDLRFAPVMAAP